MIDLCRLHWLTSGNPDSPAILFLHGFLGSGLDWEEIICGLSDEFYCVAPDLPGHGRTAKSPNPEAYSMRGAAEALQVTLDELRIANPALVGYSMGGRLALHLGMTHPQRWNRIVIESASPGIESALEHAKRKKMDEKKAKQLETIEFEVFLQEWYEQPLFQSLKKDRVRFDRLLERRKINDPAELAKSLRGMSAGVQPPLWHELQRFDIPLLVIAGDGDTKYRKIAKKMARSCKKASLALVDGTWHNVHEENPKEYTTLLRQFLTETI
ncbi:MAG TPA: 2-succinyl-6-hydroxy-2,4-cyclohexadiene-1-carboxylate synthase [Candidatus Binatia bacterium]|nr:2-succinyl-6-hydroxy-2,4-cyclohexadiene-1-carboxylate synthase [Candidatus Binatia bacterium]